MTRAFFSEPSSSAVLIKSSILFALNMATWRAARDQKKYHNKTQWVNLHTLFHF